MHLLPTVLQQLVTAGSRMEAHARHDHDVVYTSLRERLKERFGGRTSSLRVLDFGCGYKYPLVALLRRDVAEVVGLDVLPVYRDGLKPLVRAFSESGGVRGLSWGMLRHYEARLYHKHLTGRYGSPRNHEDLPIVRYDGTKLPFEDCSFDCVVSNAVLMEIPGSLRGYAREMARVLSPGGAVDLEWHNFYSWSGGLTHEEHQNPWGHLLGGCYWEPL
ncbi:MAG TPA: class I SAM-dependent methyltransferase, partial [Armatimonadota bacterium]